MKRNSIPYILGLTCFAILVIPAGLSVSCGDKDEDKDKPKPAVMTVEAQQAAIQEAVQSALPSQRMAPPLIPPGPGGSHCPAEPALPRPTERRAELAIRYKHSCKAQ